VAWDGQVIDGVESSEKAERNEYGEQTGVKRVLEVIQGIDWSASLDGDGDEDADGETDLGRGNDDDFTFTGSRSTNILGSGRFSGLDDELQREMMELKFSMLSNDADEDEDDTQLSQRKKEAGDEDLQVNQLPALMEQVVAIREAGLEMSPSERERFAKREIERIMRELG
jgi:ribosomal protein S12 methylthiotransferase accessory factor YcaO